MPVECNSDESHTPGTFCVKIVKQGPRGFICESKKSSAVLKETLNSRAILELFFSGDGRWRQVIRRCAAVSDTGVTGVCNWGVLENGVYWEECYCSADGCNRAKGSQRFATFD